MLVTAAVCPHPPLLVPEAGNGAASELDDLRAACDEAVRRLVAADAEVLAVVGSGWRTRTYAWGTPGSLRPYGVDVHVGHGMGDMVDLDAGEGGSVLPLSLTVGVWLLERTLRSRTREPGAPEPPVPQLWEVRADAPTEECLRLGGELADRADRVALLVMGDGSARRDERAPGYVDPRSPDFDASAVRALANGDAGALAKLDPQLAEELLAAGRPAWQVLAGAAGEARFRAELLAEEAPYGVSYAVASWERRDWGRRD